MSEILTVREVHWHSEGIFEIQFEKNGMTFTPGDCLALHGEDGSTSRPYSFASGVNEDLLRFVIRRMDGGIVSTYLSSRKPGDKVQMSPPFGWFRPGNHGEGQSFVFIATGTGISPFLSHFRSKPENPPVVCLHGVKTLADAVDHESLKECCDLRLCISKEKVDGCHHGRVTDLLDELSLEEGMHYNLCGLDAMIDDVTEWLETKGIDISHIHRECFFNASYT